MIYVIVVLVVWNIILTYLIYKIVRKLRYDYSIVKYKIEKDGIWKTTGMFSERKLKWFWWRE